MRLVISSIDSSINLPFAFMAVWEPWRHYNLVDLFVYIFLVRLGDPWDIWKIKNKKF